jgi:hypothetical protein
MKRNLVITDSVIVAAGLFAAMWAIFGNAPKHEPLTLILSKDTNYSPYFEGTAVLVLTNNSTNYYGMCMPRGTNTDKHQPGLLGRHRGTVMVACAFSDQTPHGWSNWTDLPSTGNNYPGVILMSRQSMLLRVPLPAYGGKRKVAVICEQVPAILPLFRSAAGARFFNMLPMRVRNWLGRSKPRKVWCDTELSLPPEFQSAPSK